MNAINVLRWIGVLPSAILGATLACLLLCIFLLIGDVFSGDLWLYLRNPSYFYFEHFFTSFFLFATFGFAFVEVGKSVAPIYKKITAFILFIVISIVFGFILILCFKIGITNAWRLALNSILTIAAAGLSSYSTTNE